MTIPADQPHIGIVPLAKVDLSRALGLTSPPLSFSQIGDGIDKNPGAYGAVEKPSIPQALMDAAIKTDLDGDGDD